MKAIIMAGGKGTRLRPVCEAMPKPMTGLLGNPLLERITRLLKENGFDELCLTLGYLPEQITDYFGDGSAFGVSMRYRVEKTPLGTAGGVRSCLDFVGNEDFLVISGDAACDFDLADLAREHRRRGGAVTMALCPNPEPLPYGTVLTDRAGRVVSFIEKPSWDRVVTDLVNTGVYMVTPEAMQLFPENTPFDFARDLFPLMEQKGLPIVGLPMDGYWCDIGSPRSYLRCCLDALDGKLRLAGEAMPGIRAPAALPEDVHLIAPCYICDGAVIERGATVGRSVVHAGSRIGAYSRVVNSVVDGGDIGEACVVSGTVVCRGAVLGPDTVTTRGDVVSARGEYAAPRTEAERPPRRKAVGLVREIACDDRARLMREMSAVLWEAGADFSDGITLPDGPCLVRIAPLAEESAVTVEAVGGREKERLAMCRKYSALAEKFGGKDLKL